MILSPEKVSSEFKINDFNKGVMYNNSNIMMIKNFDPDHADEPIDFDRDFEYKLELNTADHGHDDYG
jgi:hypothetical protein